MLGISCCLHERAEPVHGVIDRYVRAAATFTGADVVLLPALADLMDAAGLAGHLDGLLLTGSPSNVAGEHYGCPGMPGPHDTARDRCSFALIHAMRAQGKPILGICRGHQELNVALGGSLRTVEQHHSPQSDDIPAMFAFEHDVLLTPGGRLAQTMGTSQLTVNSVHYQAIDALAPDLTVEAICADGVIEAISDSAAGSWITGVQWHPEWDTPACEHAIALFAGFGAAMQNR